ncbi:hypothetical protein PQ689_03155 [Thermoanaerobacterium thermosaccharolyticum]|uniref:hypothetical protein n=1 Tax=Thermoanaerobacterium thermosaccharolyticum TaxID=1517 RepID=UPI003DA82563
MNMSWGHRGLSNDEKAEIILKALDEYIAVDWNFKEVYLKAIKEGLKKIEMEESK